MIVRVWRGLTTPGRCRACRATIAWVTTDEGKAVPFDPAAVPLRVDVHATTGARFEVYEVSEARHVCRRRPVDKK